MKALKTLLVAASFAGSAAADAISLADSMVRMDDDHRCFAVITLLNAQTDDPNTYHGTVSLDGLNVDVTLVIGRGADPDTLTAFPPEGYVAVPPAIEANETRSGEILICDLEGVGA